MNDSAERPNPDDLLARVQKQERAASKGRLKIYFGSFQDLGLDSLDHVELIMAMEDEFG